LSSATPLALVVVKLNFDKNPRLATVVGFLFNPRWLATTKNMKSDYWIIGELDYWEGAPDGGPINPSTCQSISPKQRYEQNN